MMAGIIGGKKAAAPGLSNRWRIYATAKPDGASYMSACEIEMRTAPNGASVAFGGTATASTYQTSGGGVPSGGFVPGLAFDGVKTTASSWTASSSSVPQWIEYQFTSPVTIEEVVFSPKPGDPGGTPSTFDVQYYDGSAWITYWTETWDNPSVPHAVNGAKSLKFTRVKGKRKWRLNLTAKGVSGNWTSLYEIEFRETIGGPSLNPNGFPSCNYTRATSYLLFDGGLTTQWQSGGSAMPVNPALYLDRDVTDIGEVVIKGGATAGDSPTAGNVQYYDEATSSWVTSWSFSGLSWTGSEVKSIPKP